MTGGNPLRDLELLLRSRYEIIVLDTQEEDRVEGLLQHLAEAMDLPLFTWTRTKGLRRGESQAIYGTADPAGVLAHIESARFPGLYLLEGLGSDLKDATLARRLKDASDQFSDLPGAILLSGRPLDLPDSLRPVSATLKLPPPGPEELHELVRQILRDLRQRERVQMDLTPQEEEQLVRNLRGLTLLEAEKALTKAIVEDGRLGPEDIQRVVSAKAELIEREGLLEYYPAERQWEEVADLAALKAWLGKREVFVSDPKRAREMGLPFPKGLLLLGVPGCGKSLCATVVASVWKLPLLKLDPSTLYNKYVGETEKNFRRAMALAEQMSPVVLFIDEIEKAFTAAGEGDGGVSLRVLGSFLSWMQDRTGDVFVVATANDVMRLPPELLRKGRFDELFFVDLPDERTRAELFDIHLRKRRQDPDQFDLPTLSEATVGFSGSEIEQVVVSALYTAAAGSGELTTELLQNEAAGTHPLSDTMAEKIEALRAWARQHTTSAN